MVFGWVKRIFSKKEEISIDFQARARAVRTIWVYVKRIQDDLTLFQREVKRGTRGSKYFTKYAFSPFRYVLKELDDAQKKGEVVSLQLNVQSEYLRAANILKMSHGAYGEELAQYVQNLVDRLHLFARDLKREENDLHAGKNPMLNTEILRRGVGGSAGNVLEERAKMQSEVIAKERRLLTDINQTRLKVAAFYAAHTKLPKKIEKREALRFQIMAHVVQEYVELLKRVRGSSGMLGFARDTDDPRYVDGILRDEVIKMRYRAELKDLYEKSYNDRFSYIKNYVTHKLDEMHAMLRKRSVQSAQSREVAA